MYKQVLMKISGEQLSGEHKSGIDPKVAAYLADEIKQATAGGCQIVVVAGGGNMVRGAEVAGHGIRRVTAEHMGMLSGLINAMAMTDIFESRGLTTRCMSNIFADQVAEVYSYRRAQKHLAQGRVLIVAGGIGRPYFTHDTAAVNLALELGCDAVLKATKVDGVYTSDPHKNPDAKLLPTISYQEALRSDDVQIMDKAALGLAMEHGQKIVIFNPMTKGILGKVVAGKSVGTVIGD